MDLTDGELRFSSRILDGGGSPVQEKKNHHGPIDEATADQLEYSKASRFSESRFADF